MITFFLDGQVFNKSVRTILNETASASIPFRLGSCSSAYQPFTAVHSGVRRPCRQSWRGHLHQPSSQGRSIDIRAHSSSGAVPLDHLLEVAESAAKAGAAVCLLSSPASETRSLIIAEDCRCAALFHHNIKMLARW